MLIGIVAALCCLLILMRPHRAYLLASKVEFHAVGLALLGSGLEIIGLRIGNWPGHGLVIGGVLLLLATAWTMRHWPGGWLFVLGVACNGLAMAVYGRMPLAPEVLAQFGLAYPSGTILAGSKDIVAQSWLASFLGDRFVVQLPLVNTTSIWSLGDWLLLAGVGWTAFSPRRAWEPNGEQQTIPQPTVA